jgi:hypothetical protein
MRHTAVTLFTAALMASCTTTSMSPELTGYQPTKETLSEILAVSRAKLASVAPGAHIFRIHIDRSLRALVFYRTDGPARHLVVEKVHDHWQVTDAPQKIDTEMPEDLIYTILHRQPTGLTKRSSQPLAVPMSSFHMASTLNSVAKLAAASGG